MRPYVGLFAGMFAMLLISCQHGTSIRLAREVDAEMSIPAPPPPPAAHLRAANGAGEVRMMKLDEQPGASAVQAAQDQRKIIRDGRISIRTQDIQAGRKRVDEMVKKFEGYYDNEEMQNDDNSVSYSLNIRIPSANFDKLLAALATGGDEITERNIHQRDVTTEYIDTESRLQNKREYLKRYRELLVKAQSVKDITAIEENIRTLQEEIESSERQLKFLNNQIDYSTLNLYLFQKKPYVYKPEPEDGFGEQVKHSLSRGWSKFTTFLLWIVSMWPFLLAGSAIYFPVRKWRSKRKSLKK
ncbi:MAG: DUF4349 domain-containing protein [Marinilabiliales bacterium]|nr:DUF4349 domain-containing protein [Marinilabiliales bacterium]